MKKKHLLVSKKSKEKKQKKMEPFKSKPFDRQKLIFILMLATKKQSQISLPFQFTTLDCEGSWGIDDSILIELPKLGRHETCYTIHKILENKLNITFGVKHIHINSLMTFDELWQQIENKTLIKSYRARKSDNDFKDIEKSILTSIRELAHKLRFIPTDN